MMRTLALLALAAASHAKGLTDAPLTGAHHQPLTGGAASWTATSVDAGISIPATVPGDLVTDLERAGKIGDPLFERNFKSLLWDASNWTFSTQFPTSQPMMRVMTAATAAAAGGHVYLVLDGVKMGAEVYLNGHQLGTVSDQFLRCGNHSPLAFYARVRRR
eukprot:COSAG01_NODE_19_length_39011_cov_38.134968_3_plen_161_part_00